MGEPTDSHHGDCVKHIERQEKRIAALERERDWLAARLGQISGELQPDSDAEDYDRVKAYWIGRARAALKGGGGK